MSLRTKRHAGSPRAGIRCSAVRSPHRSIAAGDHQSVLVALASIEKRRTMAGKNEKEIKQLTDGKGARVVFDAVGGPSSSPTQVRCAAWCPTVSSSFSLAGGCREVLLAFAALRARANT